MGKVQDNPKIALKFIEMESIIKQKNERIKILEKFFYKTSSLLYLNTREKMINNKEIINLLSNEVSETIKILQENNLQKRR